MDVGAIESAVAGGDATRLKELVGLCESKKQASEIRTAILKTCAVIGSDICFEAGIEFTPEDVIERDSLSWTPLHYAASGGHADIVDRLLKLCGDAIEKFVDTPTLDTRVSRLMSICGGQTPLHMACAAGEIEVVQILLTAKADTGVKDLNGWKASSHGRRDSEILELLIKSGAEKLSRDDIETYEKMDYEAFTRQRIVKLAFSHSVDHVEIDGDYSAPQLSYKEHVTTGKETLAQKARQGVSLKPTLFLDLVGEAGEGNVEALERLLRVHDVKKLRVAGSTCLHSAVSLGCPEAVGEILKFLNWQGKPKVKKWAMKKSAKDEEKDGEKTKLPSLPTIDTLDSMGLSPLHAAAEMSLPECARLLIAAKADLELRTKDSRTHLGQALQVDSEGGRTALHIACANPESASIIEFLIDAKADPSASDSFGLDSRDLVVEGFMDAVERGKSTDRWSAAAKILGITMEDIGEVEGIGEISIADRRRQRAREMRKRMHKEKLRLVAEKLAVDLDTIAKKYPPLDRDLVDGEVTTGVELVEWREGEAVDGGNAKKDKSGSLLSMCIVSTTDSTPLQAEKNGLFIRQPTLASDLASGVVNVHEGLYAFDMLSEKVCDAIWKETENYHARAADLGLPLPVRHDGGLDLSRVFPKLLAQLATAVYPLIHKFLPEDLHDVKLRHAFRTKNFVGRKEAFKRHRDKYAVTANVCIRKSADTKGSGVFFYDSGEPSERYKFRHDHRVGLALLHSSKEWHMTENLLAGERGSIIMWFDHEH